MVGLQVVASTLAKWGRYGRSNKVVLTQRPRGMHKGFHRN
jgi:hypothetical protein